MFWKKKVLEEFSSGEKLCLDMTNSLQVKILILSKEVGYLFWVWINSAKIHEWQLFLVILQTRYINSYWLMVFGKCLWLKAYSHDINFPWTFDPFFYLPLHERNTVRKYPLQLMKYKQRDTHFHLSEMLKLKDAVFLMQNSKYLINNF